MATKRLSNSVPPSSAPSPKRIAQPLTLGGQHTVGDPAVSPPGTCLYLYNLLTRPGRFPARPPFTYDSLMNVCGLANFDDRTNHVQRLTAIDTSHFFYEKGSGTQSETWSASLATLSGTRLTDYCNYLGKLWMMIDDGSGLPSVAASFDGTNSTTSPFNSAVVSRTVTSFIERLFLAYPRVTFTNNASSGNWAYSISSWTKTALTASDLVSGSTTVHRIFPTSTAASACSTFLDVAVTVSNTVNNLLWRGEFRGVDPSYNAPFTMEIIASAGNVPIINHVYTAGTLMVSGGFIYKCTTAGTSAGAPPVYGTTIGGTTADNTVTWTNIGTDTIVATQNLFVANATDRPNFTATYLLANLPERTNSTFQFGVRLKLYNQTSTSLTTLAPIDFALKDGLTDGDVRKSNHGHQFTVGDFYYPFFNQESSATATIDMNAIVWSEIRTPQAVRAVNFYQPAEFTDYPTAACVISNRYLVFYRNGFIQFAGQNDPDTPIRRERIDTRVGCLGPRAVTVYENTAFFIGETDIYSYDGTNLTPLCGDGMREVIMKKGTQWVEYTGSGFKRPLIAFDESQLILWIYTQKGYLFAYDIRSQRWSTHFMTGFPLVLGYGTLGQIDAMAWNQNTNNMYFAFGGHGLTRMQFIDVNNLIPSANDTFDNTGNTYAAQMSFVKVIEAVDGNRPDISLDDLIIYYQSTIVQTGQLVTLNISFDQGATWHHTITCTPVKVSSASAAGSGLVNNYFPLRLSGINYHGPTITVQVLRSGQAGESGWALSPRVLVRLRVLSIEERYDSNPTPGART